MLSIDLWYSVCWNMYLVSKLLQTESGKIICFTHLHDNWKRRNQTPNDNWYWRRLNWSFYTEIPLWTICKHFADSHLMLIHFYFQDDTNIMIYLVCLYVAFTVVYVLHKCALWFLSLREICEVQQFGKSVFRKAAVPKKENTTL